MSATVSLMDLVNLSIGTPDVGSVNFNALRTLLLRLLDKLDIQDVTAEWQEQDRDPRSETEQQPRETLNPYQHMEDKLQEMERKMAVLSQDLLSLSGPASTASDMGQLIRLQKSVEANGDSVSKAMTLIQDLQKEIDDLKTWRDSQQKLFEASRSADQSSDQLPLQTEPAPPSSPRAPTPPLAEPTDTPAEETTSPSSPTLLPDSSASPPPLSPPSGVDHYAETVEALQDVRQLKNRHEALEDRVTLLERNKAEISQLQELRALLDDLAKRDLPHNLLEQLNQLKAMEESLSAEREKLKDLKMSIPTFTVDPSRKGDEAMEGEMAVEITYLRSAVQDLQREIEQLKVKQQETKQSEQAETRTDTHLQDQLDKLRNDLEGLMSSSTNLLSKSPAQDETHVPEDTRRKEEQRQSQMLIDTSKKVSKLFQHYEKLQTLVPRAVQKGQDSDLMAHVQNAILRLQADCEKLSNAASFLLRDERDKQKQLDHLSKSVEELDEKKADKERIQMEIDDKADKKALVSKVNWLQFEATTEQLNNMLQEVLNKMSGQNQDYQKTVEEISKCKLDRMELDPLKQQLEDQLKAFLKQHEERPTPEDNVDDAAGIKKQLVAGVHCISCDRAVEMVAPGSLKPGSNHTNYKLAKSEKNLVNTRSIHSVMCKEVERVQSYIKITESVPRKNFSQSRLPPLTGPVRKASDSVPRHKQISQVSECRYPSVSRSSGGSHTLANPVRRGTRLLPVSQTIQAKESKEIDTLDLEGRTYRGMNPRPPSKLPPISPNDSLSAAARTLVERPASLLSQRSQTTTVQLLLSQKTAGKR